MNARLLPVVVMTSVALLAQGQPPTRVVPPAPASAPRGVRFDDVTTSAGLDGVRHVSGSAAKEYIPETTGSGVALVDADGDGWLDLFVAGYVEFDVAHPPPSPSTPASPTTPAADAASSGQGMGAVYAATRAPRRARPPVPQQRGRDVHRDDARGGRRGPRATRRCPRDAIGSVVRVTAGGVTRKGEVASGRGQVSQSDLRVHVGLGSQTMVSRLDVRWANGEAVTYAVDRVDAHVVIDQASGAVRYER